MISLLDARLHRLDDGCNPMSAAHSARCGAGEWSWIDQALVDGLGQRNGGFPGQAVLDIGCVPGQYTAVMAQRRARHTLPTASRAAMTRAHGA